MFESLMCVKNVDITIPEGLLLSVVGFAIVFLVLAFLMVMTLALGKAPSLVQKVFPKKGQAPVNEAVVPAPAETVAEEEANGSAGQGLVLIETREEDAAMLMAIVADAMETPLNQLHFKSIKKVADSKEN
jgi:Na+-transporting methylmalonyl-CoA/oxaloacetate decarboxylase gamma subunit